MPESIFRLFFRFHWLLLIAFSGNAQDIIWVKGDELGRFTKSPFFELKKDSFSQILDFEKIWPDSLNPRLIVHHNAYFKSREFFGDSLEKFNGRLLRTFSDSNVNNPRFGFNPFPSGENGKICEDDQAVYYFTPHKIAKVGQPRPNSIDSLRAYRLDKANGKLDSFVVPFVCAHQQLTDVVDLGNHIAFVNYWSAPIGSSRTESHPIAFLVFDKSFQQEPSLRFLNHRSYHYNEAFVHNNPIPGESAEIDWRLASSTLDSNWFIRSKSDPSHPKGHKSYFTYSWSDNQSPLLRDSFVSNMRVMDLLDLGDSKWLMATYQKFLILNGDTLASAKNPNNNEVAIFRATESELSLLTTIDCSMRHGTLNKMLNGYIGLTGAFSSTIEIGNTKIENPFENSGASSSLVNLVFSENGVYHYATKGLYTAEFRIKKVFPRKNYLLIQCGVNNFIINSVKYLLGPDTITSYPFGDYENDLLIRLSTIPEPEPAKDLAIDSISCNKAFLKWLPRDAEHYTLLVSNDSIPTFPVDGLNYSYSPNYLNAFVLDKVNDTRILYQGKDTNTAIYNLPANKEYWFHVIAGNGPAGQTNYNTTEYPSISYSVRSLIDSSSLELSHKGRQILCPTDTLELQVSGVDFIQWNDRIRLRERFIDSTITLRAIGRDPNQCVFESDYIDVYALDSPKIVELETVSLNPPTIQVIKHEYPDTLKGCLEHGLWISPDYIQDAFGTKYYLSNDSLYLSESRFYRIQRRDIFGCIGELKLQVDLIENSLKLAVDTLYLEEAIEEAPLVQTSFDSVMWRIDARPVDFPLSIDESVYLFAEGFSKEPLYRNFPHQIQADCGSKSDSIFLQIGTKPLTVPNAFTPNGDELNDLWWPKLSGAYEFKIFDRWGELLFVGNENDRWDGFKQGKLVPAGYYYYVIETEYQRKLTGHIHLIR